MRGVVRTPAGTWAVHDLPDPAPDEGDVLVRVRAAALNHADLLARTGDYVPDDASWRVPPDRVGFEAAGEVVVSRSSDVAVGDRVAVQAGGACAGLVVADARQLLPVADDRSWTDAVALPSAVLTAYDAFSTVAPLAPGERVLVTGATSGVGLVAVQVAQALGAGQVLGTTRDPERGEVLRALGVEPVVGTDDLVLDDDADVVLDLVGGPILEQILHRVARDGRVAQVGRLGGAEARVDLDHLARQRITLRGTTFRGRDRAELRDLVGRVRGSGVWEQVRPVVHSVHALEDAEEAAGVLASGVALGKVVLRV